MCLAVDEKGQRVGWPGLEGHQLQSQKNPGSPKLNHSLRGVSGGGVRQVLNQPDFSSELLLISKMES